MNIRVILVAALAASVLAASAADDTEARRAAARRRVYERTGGFVTAPYSGKVISVENLANVPESVLSAFADTVFAGLDMPVVANGGQDAGIILRLKAEPSSAGLLLAPENGFAEISVAWLKSDSPEEAKLAQRVTKELWRALMYLLGSGNDDQPICLMKQVRTLAELDALQSTCPCPAQFQAVTAAAKAFGVGTKRRVAYLQACKEGWASAPTNDVQKAIWEKVHSIPDKPLKIEFDPAAQKGKVTK